MNITYLRFNIDSTRKRENQTNSPQNEGRRRGLQTQKAGGRRLVNFCLDSNPKF